MIYRFFPGFGSLRIPAVQALCKRLYSPKALKDLKFVAHGADLLDDYMKNVSIYEAALNETAIVVYTVYTLN